MILDTSAILAILFAEPEAESFAALTVSATRPRLSVASYIECALRLDGLGLPDVSAQLDLLLERLGVALEPVTIEQAHAAREAARRFGKGRHPAALDFGDCFAYALAKTAGEPLLYKGEDFSRTDLERAGPPNPPWT
ncbi:MAG: type II toxin-antitoxin system VapC family toxin [Caulobacteraceae bacterium]